MTTATTPATGAAPVEGSVLDALQAAWRRSDALFELLPPEALAERPIPLRHPFVFYVGHLPAFAWNQVVRGVLGEPGFRPDFDELFERGIDPLDDGGVPVEPEWPPMSEIHAYRDEVRRRLLDAAPQVAAPAEQDVLCDGEAIWHVVLEHEVMHHETLLYMLAESRHTDGRRPADAPLATGPGVEATPVDVPAGRTLLGGHRDDQPFGWDNEFPAQAVEVDAFRIDSHPVTNARFRAFVEAGGYADDSLWSEAGRAWRDEHDVRHPHTWRLGQDGWTVRGPFDERPFEELAGWPAQVSQAEAAAFCAWAGGRLPTEAELGHAAYGTPEGALRAFPWGDEAPAAGHANAGFTRWSPVPVGSLPEGASAFGVHELVGNGWEHTSTPFRPLPGFEAWVRTYPGYSADFFDDAHTVVFGGSWATDHRLLRRSLRNWFQPHYPYVFSKFRVVHPG